MDVLSTVATVIVVGFGGYLALERPGHRGRGRGLPRLRAAVLLADPAGQPALHPGPVGAGRRRADLRPARHAGGHGGRRRAPGRCRPSGAGRVRARGLRLRSGAPGAARRGPGGRAGPDRRPGRPDRRRQDHHRQPDRPLLRRDRRAGDGGRRGRARGDAGLAAEPDGHRAPEQLPLRRHRGRQHPLRPAGGDRRGGGGRPRAWPTPTTSSPGCRRATRRCWASGAAPSARGSAS